jgi:hypothetical protein
MRSFCSSKKSSATGGPPQLGQMTFLSASRMVMFSHRILSFSARRKQLSARSCCACNELSHKERRHPSRTRGKNKPTEGRNETRRPRERKEKKNQRNWETCWYLHLGAAVLEPELDLAWLQAELPAERGALVLVGVRALLEHPAVTGEHAPLHSFPSIVKTTTAGRRTPSINV